MSTAVSMIFCGPSSICAVMSRTRLPRSGCPWGSKARWRTLALVNNAAAALGQAATQAPHPMQAADRAYEFGLERIIEALEP